MEFDNPHFWGDDPNETTRSPSDDRPPTNKLFDVLENPSDTPPPSFPGRGSVDPTKFYRNDPYAPGYKQDPYSGQNKGYDSPSERNGLGPGVAPDNSDPHGDNDERHYGSGSNGTGSVSTPGSNPTTHTGAGYQSPAGSPSQNTSTQGSSPAVNPRDDQVSEQQSLRHSSSSPYDEYGLTEGDWESINKGLEDSEDDDEDKDDDDEEDDDTKPILLDLDGNGVGITELSKSNQFKDAGGDGLLHRTAWAAAGDGVLFFDVGNDGLIGEKREYVFTEWDPTATSDLKALRAAFDTNGDGKLTAADAGFSQFKVMVTKPDGSTEAKTLAELGITEINLEGDATEITLPDGSRITAQTASHPQQRQNDGHGGGHPC